jgi:hypothetical protein
MIYLGVVCPHHFLDGIALSSSIAVRMAAYVMVPRIFWWLLDRSFTDQEVPSYLEMCLKSDIDRYYDADGSLVSHLMDPNLFLFRAKVDKNTPSRTTIGFHQDSSVMDQIRAELRRNKVTVTTSVCALAIKLMARLVDTSSGTGLVITISCDARTLGKWGDKRDKRKIPGFGNFSFLNLIAIENSKARGDDLNSLAKFLRHEIARVDTDIDYRMHMLQVKAITKDYFCGVSSVHIPKAAVRLGIAPAYGDSFIDFGDIPRVWFYVVTVGSSTQVAVDVLLPGVDNHVKSALKSVVKGSALEPLFNQLDAFDS